MKKLCLAIAIFVSMNSIAQLPIDYKLVKGPEPAGRGDYYTNGRIKFKIGTPLNGDDFGDKRNMETLASDYGVGFKKIANNFYIGFGSSKGVFRYIVYNKFAYIVTSETNTKEFSDMCQFVLNSVRNRGFWD